MALYSGRVSVRSLKGQIKKLTTNEFRKVFKCLFPFATNNRNYFENVSTQKDQLFPPSLTAHAHIMYIGKSPKHNLICNSNLKLKMKGAQS